MVAYYFATNHLELSLWMIYLSVVARPCPKGVVVVVIPVEKAGAKNRQR
jgi:hypothetical protein